MRRNIKITFYFLFLFAMLAIAVGYYWYNKPAVNIKTAHALQMDAIALYQAFASDTSLAQKKYNGKILIVHGRIQQLSQTTSGGQIILLHAGAGRGVINCTLDNGIWLGAKKMDDTLVVKGYCSGMGPQDEFTGIAPDVYLERCILPEELP